MLRSRLTEPWTLDSLAAQVYLSRTHLTRCFDTVLGVGPITYLKQLRVEKMAELLITTDLPIGTIARQVGWSDPGFAGRLFRTRYGVTPTEYRRRHAAPPVG